MTGSQVEWRVEWIDPCSSGIQIEEVGVIFAEAANTLLKTLMVFMGFQGFQTKQGSRKATGSLIGA
ncbi:hypothetical protein [Thermostichus vulcanus]|uniref:Uncharacterized protein n=1 Tax=Thermostichus vulcanus str. 'Rupite' TaxID=2813851 RepID=A0ABT0C8F2_THEVL|nr:hypothetical protein [Thermostichus vulcanus]MCJ2541992.1 hypothetical protein [Thermostichus vulcanus str. 'Rupite']